MASSGPRWSGGASGTSSAPDAPVDDAMARDPGARTWVATRERTPRRLWRRRERAGRMEPSARLGPHGSLDDETRTGGVPQGRRVLDGRVEGSPVPAQGLEGLYLSRPPPAPSHGRV